MISTLDRGRRAPIDRSADRYVALVAITLALGFLIAALGSLGLPPTIRRGLWLPLHLALAGGASTAIAGILPFFVAAFAAAPSAGVPVRAAGVLAVAFGAVGVTIGVVITTAPLAVAGGLLFVAGIGLVGIACIRPLAVGLGPSRGIVTGAYLGALVMVAFGALLAIALLAGWEPVAGAWVRLKPAHAWLNVGFVSVIISATLIHFFPTVVGGRIGAHASGRVAVLALLAAPWIVAAGYGLESAVLVRFGAGLGLIGAVALSVYGARTWAVRARWTTDPGWHRFAIGGLASAIGWFVVGMAILAARTISSGADPAGWLLEPVVGPLVAGWAGLAMVSSATHLVPAVGPGDQAAHARQRELLGRLAVTRLIALNLGVAGISLGPLLGRPEIAVAGTAILAGALFVTVLLLGRAMTTPRATSSRRG